MTTCRQHVYTVQDLTALSGHYDEDQKAQMQLYIGNSVILINVMDSCGTRIIFHPLKLQQPSLNLTNEVFAHDIPSRYCDKSIVPSLIGYVADQLPLSDESIIEFVKVDIFLCIRNPGIHSIHNTKMKSV